MHSKTHFFSSLTPVTNSVSLYIFSLLICLIFLSPTKCLAQAPINHYEQASDDELKQAEHLFNLLFTQSSNTEAKTLAIKLGFTWKENKKNIYLKEMNTQNKRKTGKGEYRFSKIVKKGIALQAPHRYHDKHTGVIVKKLFSQYDISSIALNSLPRNAVTKGISASADLAHSDNNYHIAYSRAFANHFPHGNLIQLHGFNAKKRTSIIARDADIIMSTASSWSSNYLFKVQKCLSTQNWVSLRFPQQVKELGATQNSIASVMRQLGHVGFTHLELNLSSREAIVNDKSQLKRFAGCLLELVP